MRAKKITAFILAAALCATSMSGCGINKDAKAASMNGQTVTLGVANFYCRYEQATMEDVYKAYLQTSDIWSKDISGNGTTLEETVKDQAMETLHEMYTLQAHMKDYNEDYVFQLQRSNQGDGSNGRYRRRDSYTLHSKGQDERCNRSRCRYQGFR